MQVVARLELTQTGSCVIAGACYANNAPNPQNPCQVCNAATSTTAWTNANPNTSCDDGLWCTGTDACTAGECVHQFPTGERCTGTGLCDATSCDEEAKTCFAPDTQVCGGGEEFRCAPGGGCGGVVQSRQTQQFCSGTASACTGEVVPNPTWSTSSTCPDEQVCTATADTESCGDAVECVAFCDSNDLCWSHADASTLDFASAETYCETNDWAGKTWVLPTIQEWISVLRGCQDGWVGNENHVSTCALAGCSGEFCDSVTLCGACDAGDGPADSSPNPCFWIPELVGTCANDSTGYWSKTTSNAGHWVSYPLTGYVSSFGVDNFTHHAKCVTTR